MGAKFSFRRLDGWVSSSREELIQALNVALPDLSCLVCRSQKFVFFDIMDGSFEQHLRPNLPYTRLENLYPGIVRPIISLTCEACGFEMQFNEETILRKAGVAPAQESAAEGD